MKCDGTTQENSIASCSSSPPTGYTSACSDEGQTTRAEVACGSDSPEDGGLSGGAVAGIVIGSIVGLGIIGYLIHLCGQADKKKKAAAAAEATRRQNETSAAQQRREREAQQRRDVAAAQRALASAQQPPVR